MNRLSIIVCLLLAFHIASANHTAAQTLNVGVSFEGEVTNPQAALLEDFSGNFEGMSLQGGLNGYCGLYSQSGCGTIYVLGGAMQPRSILFAATHTTPVTTAKFPTAPYFKQPTEICTVLLRAVIPTMATHAGYMGVEPSSNPGGETKAAPLRPSTRLASPTAACRPPD
jgi:hypothetical protein